jgi:outer membrane protein OmpA-like peptidoglycan-associated protein
VPKVTELDLSFLRGSRLAHLTLGCTLAACGMLSACTFSATLEAGGDPKPVTPAATGTPAAAIPTTPTTEPASEPAAVTTAAPAPKANVKVHGAKLDVPGSIVFQPDGAQFQAGAGDEAVLIEIKTYLDQTPRVTRLRVEGHTNNSRPSDQSLALSGQRASTVKQWLQANGINPGRLLAAGFGDAQPIANNADAAGRAQNERIQFRIAELDGKPYLGADPLAGGKEFP